MTGAESFKYFALMSSIPVALLTLRFCNCCCINEEHNCVIENSIPSGTLLSTKACNLAQFTICLSTLELRSL